MTLLVLASIGIGALVVAIGVFGVLVLRAAGRALVDPDEWVKPKREWFTDRSE